MFEEKRDGLFYSLTLYFERDFSLKTLLSLFLIGSLSNAAAWFIALYSPQKIAEFVGFLGDLEDKVLHYLLVFPFFFAFLMSFSICKFVFRKHDRRLVPENEFMSGYASRLKSENIRRVFFVSLIFSGINVILLILTVIWFRNI